MSKLIVDSDLDMGAFNILLDATQTVDGEDVGVKLVTKTRNIFLPADSFYRVAGSLTFKDHYAGYDFDGAAEELFGNFRVPADYSSGGVLKVWVIAQAAAEGSCNIKTAHCSAGEAHTIHTNDAAGVAVSGVTVGTLYVSTILTFTNLVAADIIGLEFEWVSGDFFVLGMEFSYTANF